LRLGARRFSIPDRFVGVHVSSRGTDGTLDAAPEMFAASSHGSAGCATSASGGVRASDSKIRAVGEPGVAQYTIMR
jgi:hypothetical protein